VAFALSELVAAPHAATIASLVHRTGLSSRRFIELFTNEVGMSPKRFCRVRRFQRALTLLDTDMGDPSRVPQATPRFGRGVDPRPPRAAGLVETALACGYYDQAHFIREFRAFAGVTPTTYGRARVAHRGHLPLD
jgi:AraC-like DNA-binding protein